MNQPMVNCPLGGIGCQKFHRSNSSMPPKPLRQPTKTELTRLPEVDKLRILQAALREVRNAGSLLNQDKVLLDWKNTLPQELYLRLIKMLRARTRP